MGTGTEDAILICLEIAGRMVVRRAARISLGIWIDLRRGKRKGKRGGEKTVELNKNKLGDGDR